MNAQRSILCVDDDRDITELVQAVLVDEGYLVSCLYETAGDALMRTVGTLEPDVVLLDGGMGSDYGGSWEVAAALARRPRPVPVVMFTAHRRAVDEATTGMSGRAVEAQFTAIVPKPFELDDFLAAVARAAGQSTPFDRRPAAEADRTRELLGKLETRGATDIRPSSKRESALFRDRGGSTLQVYWWQQRGVYQLGRYGDDGILEMIGQFTSLDAALELALPNTR